MKTNTQPKWTKGTRRKTTISYHEWEEERTKREELALMRHYGWNKSQMYKTLRSERHQLLFPSKWISTSNWTRFN